MAYTVEITKRAVKQLESLPRDVQKGLIETIDSLAADPRPVGMVKMTELKQCYRLRRGDYRIVYTVNEGRLVVLVLSVANRRDVYSSKEIEAIRKVLRQVWG